MKMMTLISLLIAISGCSNIDYSKHAGLASISNTDRNFIVDYGDGKEGTQIRRCLEAPGPATALNDLTVNSELSGDAGKVTDGKVKIDVTNTEKMAKLYEVSSILQYAHAMSYRLCEAGINGYIGDDQYMDHFDKIISSTEALLTKQLEISKEETRQQEIETEQLKLKLQSNDS